jgi:antitoxin (DNA-binding transcriptional repressor) of toxin-antitoxin stability system
MKSKSSPASKAAKPRASNRARYEIAPEAGPRMREKRAVRSEHAGKRVVSATEAARNFSDLINRVCYRGETYIVERGGTAMCELSPVAARRCTGAELLDLLATLTPPAEEYLAVVEEVTRRQATVEPSTWEK